MATGFVFHERYLWHNTGRHAGPFGADASGWLEPDVRHRENADGKRRIRSLLAVTGLLDELTPIAPRPATVEEVTRVHAPAYVERIKAESDHWGGDGGDGSTAFGKGSYEVALLSAGGVIAAVDAVLDGTVDNAFALVRPPGHHALPDMGMGFCLFGNAAIATRHLRDARGVERVAIVDWDVHHGNGTDAIFRDDDSVLFVSLHQWPFYPGTGGPDDQAETTLNIPMSAGSGDAEYLRAFEHTVEPAVARFAPELVLVSAGFDAHEDDPLAEMRLTEGCFREMAERCRAMAPRTAAILEGGYELDTLPDLVQAALEGFR
jgi:acetoin utilization deacetylase AcuC-like enzyme